MITVNLHAPVQTGRGTLYRIDFAVNEPLAVPLKRNGERTEIDAALMAQLVASSGGLDANIFGQLSAFDMAVIVAALFAPVARPKKR